MRSLTFAAPKFDEATEHSFAWAEWTAKQIEEYIEMAKFWHHLALPKLVLNDLNQDPKSKWFVHYDHGSEYVLWGQPTYEGADPEPIINLDNLKILKGMRVYNMNCLSGKGLGAHAVDAGVLEFLGYMDAYAFTTDALDEHRDATSYGLIRCIKLNLQLRDVVEDMRENGYRIADQLWADEKLLASAILTRDMNNLVCYWEGGPPPPQPKCLLSRIIQNLFGRRTLGFLRRLRQKIRPEDFDVACGFRG